MPLEKALDLITEADLQQLVADAVAEGKSIEYKASLPDNTHEGRREFLADVSSFANAAGGHLIFGIREENGVPADVCGIPDADVDAQLLQLENVIRDSIEPRIPGLTMQPVPLSTEGIALVIRIPHSWAQPHVVSYRRHWRFYSRNSAGKYPLDVSEVRAACVLSETIAERIALFRSERLGRIASGETPVVVGDTAKMVLHIVPFGAFNPDARFDISSITHDIWTLEPICGSVAGHRYNLEGLVSYDHPSGPEGPPYVQVFRNGIVEAVETRVLPFRFDDEEIPRIPSVAYEEELLKALPRYLLVQEQLGVSPPLVVMLTLLGVRGYVMAVRHKLDRFGEHAYPIDRDVLLLPEAVMESFEIEPGKLMQPIFDAIWNAAGWPRSMNYDEAGMWGKGPNYRR
jgi:hypothetical protein